MIIFIIFEIIATVAIVILYLKYEEKIARWERKQLLRLKRNAKRIRTALRLKRAKKALTKVNINKVLSDADKKEIVLQYLEENDLIVYHRAKYSEVTEC